MDTEFLAWLAGFYDGEGSFMATEQPQIHLMLTNTHKEALDMIQRTLGFGQVRTVPLKSAKHKQCYKFEIWNYKDAGKLAELLLPHLRIKRRHAEIIVALTATMGLTPKHTRIPPELINARQQLYVELRALNRRGAQ